METVIERGCGLDVHKKSVAACVRVPGPKGTRESHVRTCGTMAAELAALREWLQSQGVTQVAMESTGVYWKPVWAVLEEAFTCLLVNAAHVKHRGSFVPPDPPSGRRAARSGSSSAWATA